MKNLADILGKLVMGNKFFLCSLATTIVSYIRKKYQLLEQGWRGDRVRENPSQDYTHRTIKWTIQSTDHLFKKLQLPLIIHPWPQWVNSTTLVNAFTVIAYICNYEWLYLDVWDQIVSPNPSSWSSRWLLFAWQYCYQRDNTEYQDTTSA